MQSTLAFETLGSGQRVLSLVIAKNKSFAVGLFNRLSVRLVLHARSEPLRRG